MEIIIGAILLATLAGALIFLQKERAHARKVKAAARESARYARKRAENLREPEWNKPTARIIK